MSLSECVMAMKRANTGGRSGRGDEGLTVPTMHVAGRARAVRGQNAPQGVRQTQGNPGAKEILKDEVGRPHEKSQAVVGAQSKECTEEQASPQKQSGSSRRRQHTRQWKQ